MWSLPLSGVGHCDQFGEVQLCPGSMGSVSGDYSGLCLFQGFSLPSESQEAAINRKRISLLQAAACFYLAGSSGCPLLPLPSSSWRLPLHAVSPAHATSLLGQGGRFGTGALGSVVVTQPGSSSPGCIAQSGVPQPRLLVRRLGRGLGCPSRGRVSFRQVVSRGRLAVHQWSGTTGGGTWSSSFSPSSCWFHGRSFR